MKPMYEPERLFFQELTNILIPSECWRKGNSIYLDLNDKEPLIRFKVELGQVNITTNNLKKYKNKKQKGWQYWIDYYKNEIDSLEEDSVQFIKKYIQENPNHKYIINHSSGKDSVLLFNLWLKADVKDAVDWEILFQNTSNDTAQTYKFIKNLGKQYPLRILNPEKGWYKWIVEDKDYFIPTIMVRNCCSTFKERQVAKFYNQDELISMFLGIRRHESYKRRNYIRIMDHEKNKELFAKTTLPKNWTNVNPAIDWEDHHVWLYIMRENLEINAMYYLGYNRVGCLICPFQNNYIDLLTEKHYEHLWNKWISLLNKNYEIKDVQRRLKWSEEEFLTGEWKTGLSKIYAITKLVRTDERVEEVANILGIDKSLAEKYFENNCSVCGKKLSPAAVGMNFKLVGRLNIDSNRKWFCKNHLCEMLDITPSEYSDKLKEFTIGDCNFF